MDIPMKCIVCSKNSESGINILGKFICSDCEKTLVDTEIYDEDYDFYKDLIKKNIYGDIILKEPVK